MTIDNEEKYQDFLWEGWEQKVSPGLSVQQQKEKRKKRQNFDSLREKKRNEVVKQYEWDK